jgi:hypothetical protein
MGQPTWNHFEGHSETRAVTAGLVPVQPYARSSKSMIEGVIYSVYRFPFCKIAFEFDICRVWIGKLRANDAPYL